MIPRWTRGEWVLRAVMVAAPLVAVLASVPAGATLRPFVVVVLLVLAALWALFPASLAGVAVLLLPVVWWATAPDDPLHPLVMLAAAALLACHLAALLASYGPDRLPVDAALVRLWVRRGVLVLMPVPVVWVVADVLTGEPSRPGMWVAGLAVACLGAAGATLVFRDRPEELREAYTQVSA